MFRQMASIAPCAVEFTLDRQPLLALRKFLMAADNFARNHEEKGHGQLSS
jgi:hypothetical protein